MLDFDWDPEKAPANWPKHGVSFEEAATVFLDPWSLTTEDPRHFSGGARLVTMGTSEFGRLLLVVHIESDERIRIISPRRPTARKRRAYEEGRTRA
jgi:uncharacterized protein